MLNEFTNITSQDNIKIIGKRNIRKLIFKEKLNDFITKNTKKENIEENIEENITEGTIINELLKRLK